MQQAAQVGAGVWGSGLLGCGTVGVTGWFGGQWCCSPSALLPCHPGISDPLKCVPWGSFRAGRALWGLPGKHDQSASCRSSWFLLGSRSEDMARRSHSSPAHPLLLPCRFVSRIFVVPNHPELLLSSSGVSAPLPLCTPGGGAWVPRVGWARCEQPVFGSQLWCEIDVCLC